MQEITNKEQNKEQNEEHLNQGYRMRGGNG